MSSSTNFNLISNKVLKYSIIFTIMYTIIALMVGFLTSSQVILFDAVINLVGVALTYLSVLALKFIQKKDSFNYPFGKEAFEPFIVIAQYCIIIFICIDTTISAINVILAGDGSTVNLLFGVAFGAFATLFSAIACFILKSITKRGSTAIANVEIDQWNFSLLRSSSVLLGFSIALIIERTPLATYTSYIDPVLTIIITLSFVKIAIFGINKCVKELLVASPSDELKATVIAKIEDIDQNYKFANKVFRIGKVGKKIFIEIDYLIEIDSKLDSIYEQDQLRYEITNSLTSLSYEKWLTINFTGDINLTDHEA